ncbi:MAG: hypothetical protein AB7T27_02560 [Kiritimatiellia bacterium]
MNLKSVLVPAAALLTVLSVNAGELSLHSDEYLQSPHEGGLFIVSPLVGWNENTIKDRMTSEDVTDGNWEYGLFSLYATPRFALNDTLFFTSANDAEVWGNLLFLNIYGDPDAVLTWNVGAGHLWHRIETDSREADLDVDVSAPMLKAGALVRIKPLNITLNPYLGYSWESSQTEGTVQAGPLGEMPVDEEEDTESVLYGLTFKWHWRMAYLKLKYYLEDNQDLDRQFHVARGETVFMASKDVGFTVRVDYMEHTTSDDLSVLIGPAFVF